MRVNLELTGDELELVVQGLKLVRGSSVPEEELYQRAHGLLKTLAADAVALERGLELANPEEKIGGSS